MTSQEKNSVLGILACILILLSVIGVIILADMSNKTVEPKMVVKTHLPDTGCVVVAAINDCKIYHCTYKVPNREQTYMVKELVVCQTSNACMTVYDRRRPP